MRNSVLLALLALVHACGLGEEGRNSAGDDLPRDEQVLSVTGLEQGAFADCQVLADDLAARVGAAFALQIVSAEGRIGSAWEHSCDVMLRYAGKKAVEVVTFGDDDWPSDWLSPWQYGDEATCEAERSRQKELYSRNMNAMILGDRCYTGLRRQIPFQAYELHAVIPVPAPSQVLAWEFPAALTGVWSKVTKQISAHGAVVFRESENEDTRIVLAYAAAEAPVARIGRAAFNWYDGAFQQEPDCRTTLARIDRSLTERFAGEALDTDCVQSDQGYQPQMHYVSRTASLDSMSTHTDQWYQTMTECDAAVPAADAASPYDLHFCVQEVVGTRRFVMGYFAMPGED